MRGRVKDNKKVNFWLAVAITIVFVVVGVFLIFHHEPWCDEANPWQIAKIINFGNLFEVTKYEPHSPLYPLFLAPFAQAGLPFITTNFLSLAIVSLAVFLLLWKSPFKWWQKIAIILSAGFFYYNSVFARDYSFIVLGVVLVGLTYAGRHEHPIRYILSLALLSQSHILAGGFVALLSIGFFVECIKAKKFTQMIVPAFILIGALALLLPAIFTTLHSHQIITPSLNGQYRMNLTEYMRSFNLVLFGLAMPITELSLLFIMIYFFARYPKIFLYSLFGFGFYFSVLFIAYNTTIMPHKPAIFILLITLAVWLTKSEQRRKRSILDRLTGKLELYKLISYYIPIGTFCFVPIILSVPHTISEAYYDMDSQYSYSKEVSDVLNSLENNAVILVGSDDTLTPAISFVPYLKGDRIIYDVVDDKPFDYMVWDSEAKTVDDSELDATILKFQDRPTYIIARFNACGNSMGEANIKGIWKEIGTFSPQNKAYDPAIRIYKIN